MSHEAWCAFGADVAGTNLQQYTSGIQRVADCDALCRNSSGCTFWTFAAAQTGSGQEPYNCFVKTDPARGANGWTGGCWANPQRLMLSQQGLGVPL